jgi:hypothetical protein
VTAVVLVEISSASRYAYFLQLLTDGDAFHELAVQIVALQLISKHNSSEVGALFDILCQGQAIGISVSVGEMGIE